MFYNLFVAIGGMIALVTIWVTFNLLGERMRAVHGDTEGQCEMNSFKCLGCYVTGKCKSKRHAKG